MGAICSCCEVVQEYNPDGSPKPIQAKDQMKNDASDLRRAACACDLEEMDKLLQRMLRKQICSGAAKKEVEDAEIGMTALHYSATANHLRGCVKLILYGAEIDPCDAKGHTPLHKQMELGYRKVASFLLKRGASLNAQDKVGYTPLMVALHNGHKAASEMIMEIHAEHVQQGKEGLNLSLCSKDGWSYALILAKLGWWSDLEHLLKLMEPGMELPEGRESLVRSLNVRSKEGDTLLGWVLRYTITGGLPLTEAVNLVKNLLEKGVVATTHAFAEDVPPVALAAAIGDQELWDLIKQAAGEGALTRKDKLKRTPLHYASAKGHIWLVKQLLDCLRVDELDNNKNTPMHLAALKGHPECIHVLLESAASALKPDDKSDFSPIERVLLQPNKEGLSVLHLALSSGPLPMSQLAVLESLGKITDSHLHKDANLLVKGVVKETPLTLACQYHQHAVVKALLQERHVDVNEQTGTKETALTRCLVSVTKETARMDAAIFKLLIDAGANIDAGPGNEGNHPLMAVCKNDCNEFASLALANLTEKAGDSKLDWDIKDPVSGRTPLLEASLHNNAYVVKSILSQDKSKRHLKRTCNQGMTALCYAARGCSVDAMKILLNNKANVGCKDKSGKPVMSFCLGLDIPDSLTCAALLLRAGATPCKERDASGEGILHRAVRYGAADFIRLWARYGGDLMPKCTSTIAANLVVPTSKKCDAEIMGERAQVEDEDAIQDDSVLDQDVQPLVGEDEGSEEEDEGLDAEGNPKDQVLERHSQGNQSVETDVTGTIELVKDASMGAESSSKLKDSGSGNGIPPRAPSASTTGSKKASFMKALPVAEGLEPDWADWGLDIQLGRDASGCMQRVPSFYTGPSATQRRKWMQQGSKWWNGWIDQEHVADEHQANETFSGIDDEDWNLEEKDGLLTLDELYLVVADRQRLQPRSAVGPVSEALVDSLKGTLKKSGGQQLNKIMPIGGELVQDAIEDTGVDNSMLPTTIEEHNQSTALELVQRLFASRFEKQKINMELDPFYKPEKAYQGEPACMQADVSKFEGIDRLVGSMFTRMASYNIQPSIPLQGADLRERNIRCWIMSQSPDAFPLKLGRWISISKMLDKAVKGARSRIAPSQKLSIRKRTAFIGQPDLPTYPELEQTSALTYAVQLCRPDCVKAVLDNDINQQLLYERDLWGHTALEYAMAMLARDKNNVVLQQMVDLILIRGPVLGQEPTSKHNSMHPLCLAVVACDLPRIAWLVCCCNAPLDGSWMYAPDIPCYYKGLWEKLVGSTEAVFNPLHLSILHKRMDVTKLVLDLGADPNMQSWGLATGLFGKSVFTQREDFLKECMKHRENALKGKPDPLGDGDQSVLALRKKQLDATQKNMKEARQKKVEEFKKWLDHLQKQANQGEAANMSMGGVKIAMEKLPNLLKKIKGFIEDLVCGPDPWVSSLHLAARFGLSDICVVLLDRGATVMGGQAMGISRRTPFEEALKYARSNFRFDNCGAMRHNWLAFQRHVNGMIPPMSLKAQAKEANSKMQKLAKFMDPIAMAIKVAVMSAKMVIDVLLDAMKRPIAHYDPALKAAHVLARNKSNVMPHEAQTSILLRDIEDNGTWAWFGGPVTNVFDGNWIQAAQNGLKVLAEKEECNLKTAGETDDFKEYRKLVKTFKNKASSGYFNAGFKDFKVICKSGLANRGEYMQAKLMALKDQNDAAKARASKLNMISRGELLLQGFDMKVNALREVEKAKHLYKAGRLAYEEPSLDSVTIQMADFDLHDEDSFLGGDKAAFLSSASMGASVRRTSSRRSGSTSGRNIAFSMAANCEPISLPSFSIEDTVEDVLGSNVSVPLEQLLPTEALTESILSGSVEKLEEWAQVMGRRIEQKRSSFKDTLAEIKKEAKKEANFIVEEGKKAVDQKMEQLGIGQEEAGDGGNSGDGAQTQEGDEGDPEGEPEDDDSGLFDALGTELATNFGEALDLVGKVDIDVDGLKDSIKESLTSLELDADMDIDGLMAEFEDFQDMIDEIMEIVDSAAEAA